MCQPDGCSEATHDLQAPGEQDSFHDKKKMTAKYMQNILKLEKVQYFNINNLANKSSKERVREKENEGERGRIERENLSSADSR